METEVQRGGRFLLWIDAVGGFLVCLGDEVVLGPPSVDAGADVALLADVSRRHAVIRRDGEGYLIEPRKTVKVDGKPIDGPTMLVDGQTIELGDGVELRFRRPHALSGSARLERVSPHRTDPSADAVLLMAENCVLGPGWQNHVVCRGWEHDLILYRQGDQLFCRGEGPLTIDGRPAPGGGPLTRSSQVEGDVFSLSLEGL